MASIAYSRSRCSKIIGARVKLGFEVDPSIPVHRAEIWERTRVSEQLNSPTETWHCDYLTP